MELDALPVLAFTANAVSATSALPKPVLLLTL
jgi:hypothetical protein